jgi:ABC-2 type transport system ATP-binding protein
LETPAISCEELGKRFGNKTALDRLDLAVAQGTVHGLLGPNGAGKTTAVRVLATLLRPDSGHARVAGFDVVREASQVRARIGLAGQSAAVDEILSGQQNLVMFGRLSHLPTVTARRRASELLSQFALTEAAARPVRQYSGGMRRRLDLAASFILAPRVLFLDEPTAGLDPQSRLALWDTLGDLNGEGQTILLTTHYMEEADRLCHRLAIMDHGRILALGSPAELKQSVGADTVVTVRSTGDPERLGELLTHEVDGVTRTRAVDGAIELHVQGGDRLVARIVGTAERGGFDIVDLSIAEPSLETVFINLTGKELRD